jgi:hypothetical protein
MTGVDHFDNALDAAIDALQRGRPLGAVVADQGRTGAALRPLLETAHAARESVVRPPLSRSLEHNYAIVRAAVERAQMAAAALPREPVPAQGPWWRRRLAFASLSLPAGALALALTVGAAGATASLVATDMGSRLGDFVSPVLPEAVTGRGDDGGSAPGANGDSAGASDEAPGVDNQPAAITIGGTVTDVNGNTFTLTLPGGGGEYHVQIDSNTDVAGEILEGATAEVAGDLTAEKNLHAKDVNANGGTPAADGDKKDDAATPDDTDKEKDKEEKDKAEETPEPEVKPHAPPGQGGDPSTSDGTSDEQ